MSSVSKNAINQIVSRLNAIDGTGDFNNNVVGRIYKGKTSQDETNTAWISVIRGAEVKNGQKGRRYELSFLVDVEGYIVITDYNNQGDPAEDMIEDIKRAVILGSGSQENLNNTVDTIDYVSNEFIYKDDGGTIEAVRVTFEVSYGEIYGQTSKLIGRS